MQALKVLVIGMGILIVLGLALVAYGLVSRVSKTEREAAGFGEVHLGLATGCTIAEARGHDGRLILRATGPEARGCQQVIILDMASGAILGRIHGQTGAAQNQ